MTGSEVEIVEPLPRQAQRALVFWRNNPMLPPSYVDTRTGEIDTAGMERAAWLLVRLGIDPWDSLGDTFNIKGNIGFKADLQRTLLARVPGYDFELLEIDDEHATARLRTPTGWKPPLTKRITDTDIKTYKEQNKKNYADKPNRMLEARVTTELIDLYAKGVIRGIIAAEAWSAAAWYTDAADETTGAAEVSGKSLPSAPVHAPDGATIPAHHREPPIDADARAALLTKLLTLSLAHPDAFAAVRDQWKDLTATDTMPAGVNIKTGQVTRLHAWALSRMIADAAPTSAPGAASAPTDDPTPAAVHDDAPEATGHEPGTEKYDPDDVTRPF